MSDLTIIVLAAVWILALGLVLAGGIFRWLTRPSELSVPPLPDPDGRERPLRNRVAVWYYRPGDLLVVGVLCGLLGLLIFGAQPPPGKELVIRPETLVINMGFQWFLAISCAAVMASRVNLAAWLGLRWPGWLHVFWMAPAGVLLMWAFFAALESFGYTQWMESLGTETVQDTVKLLQNSADPWLLGLMAAAAVLSAPLCEEVIFRGYLYPVMKRFGGTWPATIASAALFATAHGNLTALAPLFLFGVLLVRAYERSGSIWAPIAIHAAFNSLTVAVQLALRFLPSSV